MQFLGNHISQQHIQKQKQRYAKVFSRHAIEMVGASRPALLPCRPALPANPPSLTRPAKGKSKAESKQQGKQRKQTNIHKTNKNEHRLNTNREKEVCFGLMPHSSLRKEGVSVPVLCL